MKEILENAALELVRVLGAALLILIPGILNAPNVQTAVALSIAAVPALLSAGIKVIQNVVPALTWAGVIRQKVVAAWADAFTRAAISVFLTFWLGWLAAPDWSTWKAALLAALIGAASAGVRALQGLFTPGESPVPKFGIAAPQNP